jgi:FixJ family two-component response regulator
LAKVPMISIVDDDPSVREATKGLVRSLGYGAAAFASAEDFLQSDHVNDTACLMTDVQLIAQGNCTPIIFITAFPEQRIRTRALEAGAVGFLSKPFDEDCLIEYIHAALNGGKARTVQS